MFLEGFLSLLDVYISPRVNEKPAFPCRTDAHQITRQGMVSAYKAQAVGGEAVTALMFRCCSFRLQFGIVTTVLYS